MSILRKLGIEGLTQLKPYSTSYNVEVEILLTKLSEYMLSYSAIGNAECLCRTSFAGYLVLLGIGHTFSSKRNWKRHISITLFKDKSRYECNCPIIDDDKSRKIYKKRNYHQIRMKKRGLPNDFVEALKQLDLQPSKKVYVHKLVATLYYKCIFKDAKTNYYHQVHHINYEPRDNHISNLLPITYKIHKKLFHPVHNNKMPETLSLGNSLLKQLQSWQRENGYEGIKTYTTVNTVEHIINILENYVLTNHNKSKTCNIVGIARPTLDKILKNYEVFIPVIRYMIEVHDFRLQSDKNTGTESLHELLEEYCNI